MKDKILKIKNRINLLTAKDPVRNVRIINKLKRRLRALENKETENQ